MASLRPSARAAAALTTSVVLLLGYAVATAPAVAEVPPASKTYVVNTTRDTVDADVGVGACDDSHKKCSLRAAIMQANFHPGRDTIKVPAGTYTLTRKGGDDEDVLGDLDVTDSVTIEGAGPSKTIIDGNGTVTGDRTMQILPTAVDTTITGLRIRGGRRMETFGTGGGLLWTGSGEGKLTVKHVAFSGSQAYIAGGLALQFGSEGDRVLLDHVTAEHNTASTTVGAIEVSLGSFGTFLMRHSIIHANKAYESAGLYVQGPTSGDDATSATVESTVFSHNHASGLSGALEYRGGTQTSLLTVTTSYFHDNVADVQGGAVGNFFGDLEVTRSTLEGNTAAVGGALYDYDGGLATFTNATFSRNTASGTGGAVYVQFFSSGLGDVVLRNSTLDRNSAPTGGGMYISAGASGGFSNTMLAHGKQGANCFGNIGGQTSLSDDGSCGFGGSADNADLKLGPIGAHGGTTRTLVPQPGSPALDTGTIPGEATIDQRGVARPMGTGLDIGAVEVCPLKPAAPHALAVTRVPKSTRLKLSWKETGCFETYSVVLRKKSKTGGVAESAKHLISGSLTTKKLVTGATYYWRVTAVGDRDNTASPWHHLTVR